MGCSWNTIPRTAEEPWAFCSPRWVFPACCHLWGQLLQSQSLTGPGKLEGLKTDRRKTGRDVTCLWSKVLLVTGEGRKKRRWELPWIKIAPCSVGLFGFFSFVRIPEVHQQDTHTHPEGQHLTLMQTPSASSCSSPCCHQVTPVPKSSACWEHLNAGQELPELFISSADMPYLLKSSGGEALRGTFAIKRHGHSSCKGQMVQRSEGHSSKCDMGISLGSGHWHQNSIKHTRCFSPP